jgi:hypothetical protein
MYCSHKQFVEIARATGVEDKDLHDMLTIISTLAQRRGSLIKSSKLQDIITKEDEQLAHMMKLLARIDKLDVASLKVLLVEIGSANNHHFTIRTKKVTDVLQKKLEQQFGNTDITSLPTEHTELQVAGDGRRYKRSLEKDLDKLLK